MTGLYTVNLMVMGGRSNLNMLREQNVFTAAEAALGPMGVGKEQPQGHQAVNEALLHGPQ